ncbi:MAG: response regulator transcription factor [Caldilineaceae bacterium]
MQKLRILLVDDHTILRDGLKLLIDAQPDMQVVGQIDNGAEVVQQAHHCRPDVVIMDIAMPGMGGAEAAAALKAAMPTIRVLALTRHSDPGYFRRLFQAGATGYVLKKTAADDLINALRSVAAGGIYIDPTLAPHVAEQLGGGSPPPPVAPAGQKPLSERETEVLRLIAWGQSNKEIAAALGLSVKTVEYYKANATEKLGLPSRTAIVRYALAQGWLQANDDGG